MTDMVEYDQMNMTENVWKNDLIWTPNLTYDFRSYSFGHVESVKWFLLKIWCKIVKTGIFLVCTNSLLFFLFSAFKTNNVEKAYFN